MWYIKVMKTILDLYTDYLLSSFGATTATGLSKLTDEALSHDDVTRFLTHLGGESKSLWQQVKKFVHQVESTEGVLAIRMITRPAKPTITTRLPSLT